MCGNFSANPVKFSPYHRPVVSLAYSAINDGVTEGKAGPYDLTLDGVHPHSWDQPFTEGVDAE